LEDDVRNDKLSSHAETILLVAERDPTLRRTQHTGAPNTGIFSSSVPTTRNLDDALTAPSDREQTKSKKEEKEYLYRKYKPCISMLHYIVTT
jgi:hypothetical protein